MAEHGDIRIGISGWRYRGWRGVFYPEKMPQRRELAFCGDTFRALEINGTRDQVQKYIYDLVGKGLFTGYVNWDKGELLAVDARQLNASQTCPNCGGQLELAGKGLVRCPFCGSEIFLSPSGRS